MQGSEDVAMAKGGVSETTAEKTAEKPAKGGCVGRGCMRCGSVVVLFCFWFLNFFFDSGFV